MYDWAGLRPFRPEVRLELEVLKTAMGKQLPVRDSIASYFSLHKDLAYKFIALSANLIII